MIKGCIQLQRQEKDFKKCASVTLSLVQMGRSQDSLKQEKLFQLLPAIAILLQSLSDSVSGYETENLQTLRSM